MASLRIPAATYRLQFNQNFTFRHALDALDYLERLGITDLYASPLLQSRRGSGHGYDVTDPTRMDSDPGDEADFEALEAELKRRGFGLILDIVPNHMAASSENPWWMDVLENGPGSVYASYFDIDWHSSSPILNNKVLLPVLGDAYGRVLENKEITPAYRDGSFIIRYGQETFPLAPKSYRRILKQRLNVLEQNLGPESTSCQEYRGILASLVALPERESLPSEAAGARRLQTEAIKERVRRLYDTDAGVRDFIDTNLRLFRGKKHNVASFRPIDRLLSEQAYLLAYWRTPNEVINYRRFFTISDLVAVRVEDPFVFEATHSVILRLIERGFVTGLRIDHIDGLSDPLGYLQRLRERIGHSAKAEDFYILVEKILAPSEKLPADWPVQGTTGYDFLNAVNRLFVDPHGARAIERTYQQFLGREVDYEDIACQKKKLVMATLLAAEMRFLGNLLGLLAAQDRYARELPLPELTQALIEVTACLEVYRTYTRSLEVACDGRRYVEKAIERARRRRPDHNQACFDFVREVLLVQDADHLFPGQREARLAFVIRWQQLTGPIVAKGIEDTALYVYHPLLSLNDVGGDPRPIAPALDDFHVFVQARAKRLPFTLNATSTHDTKRAEDVRARLNVLSEVPGEWNRHLNRWGRWNAARKEAVRGRLVPDRNEEAFLYQTLLGAWPLSPEELPRLKPRLSAYLVKATREAMVHTRWTLPNLEHENALTRFLDAILEEDGSDGRFLNDFLKFQEKIAYYGMVNGLGQALLKVACQGVPDIYQGSELWDLRLVDPDNRGPVDFDRRSALLREITEREPSPQFTNLLWKHWRDGRIKLYVLCKALGFRREHAKLFLDGDYRPLEASGKRKEHVVAFVRSDGRRSVVALVPRWLARARAPKTPRGWPGFWAETRIALAAESPAQWLNILTGETISCQAENNGLSLPVGPAIANFPVALLTDVV